MKDPKQPRTPATETVRMPVPLAKKLRDIAHAERKRVAEVFAELFGPAIEARHAKLPKPFRTL